MSGIPLLVVMLYEYTPLVLGVMLAVSKSYVSIALCLLVVKIWLCSGAAWG